MLDRVFDSNSTTAQVPSCPKPLAALSCGRQSPAQRLPCRCLSTRPQTSSPRSWRASMAPCLPTGRPAVARRTPCAACHLHRASYPSASRPSLTASSQPRTENSCCASPTSRCAVHRPACYGAHQHALQALCDAYGPDACPSATLVGQHSCMCTVFQSATAVCTLTVPHVFSSSTLWCPAMCQQPLIARSDKFCAVQLYNEEVNDLLAPENNKLQVRPYTCRKVRFRTLQLGWQLSRSLRCCVCHYLCHLLHSFTPHVYAHPQRQVLRNSGNADP